MQTRIKTTLIKMSLATVLLLGTTAYAGKITGVEANTPYNTEQPLQQYGFGSWVLDNVNVKMTDLDYNQTEKVFNPDGTYDIMTYGDAFMSEILNPTENPVGAIMGAYWPISEPAGIKVVNNDMDAQENTINCIMASSYQKMNADGNQSGYLDTQYTPIPTICSSSDDEVKEFEMNMLPESVKNYDVGSRYGQPIDIVFNLDETDKSNESVRYKVYQAIKNYTDMRLDGYKIEVLRKNQIMFPLLTFSLEPMTTNSSKFSGELWGDSNDSFFDNKYAGFEQKANDKSTAIHVTSTLGSNYADIFGLWLPSKWLPYGIFHNEEGETELVAFWGDPLDTGTNAWHRGNDYDEENAIEPWTLVTEQELIDMDIGGEGSSYSIAQIEDVTRLELDYEVEIGTNSAIGNQFTIRLTPRVAPEESQTPPSYIDENGSYILPPQVTEPPVAPAPGPEPVADAGPDLTVVVNNPVTITGSGTDLDGTIVAYEWKYGDTVLASTAAFEFTPTIAGTAILTLTVTDNDGLTGSDSMTLTVTEEDGTVPTTPGDVFSGGGGGGCTFNPNSRTFDAMFLLMIALGVLYPLRRIILKNED